MTLKEAKDRLWIRDEDTINKSELEKAMQYFKENQNDILNGNENRKMFNACKVVLESL